MVYRVHLLHPVKSGTSYSKNELAYKIAYSKIFLHPTIKGKDTLLNLKHPNHVQFSVRIARSRFPEETHISLRLIDVGEKLTEKCECEQE